jgi:DNA repair protein SbcC/Rad50
MEIKLSQISLLNYKGVKNESFQFTERETFISGANGTGKTTVFDAFVWCLFGKDHQGRSDYQLKTVNRYGQTVPKAECEVECVILVDGKQTALKRVYGENWVKPKGEAEEVFKNNETAYLINDVPVRKREYDALVDSWCDETVFKSITNPAYFPSLTKDEQRTILFSMAEEVTNESVAGDNEAFKELLLEITGKSFESYRNELLAKKRRINDEIKGIDYRIDELKRSMPEIPNLDEINKELESKKLELESVDKSISDIAQRSKHFNDKRLEVQNRINELERENQQLGFNETQKRDKAIQAVHTKISELDSKIALHKNREESRSRTKLSLEKSKTELSERLGELRTQYQSINAESLTYSDKAFICPTCERLLESEDIEAKQAQLNSNFNNDKAKRIEDNKTRGLAVKAQLEDIDKQLLQLESDVEAENVFMPGTTMEGYKLELETVSAPPILTKQQLENSEKIELLKKELVVSNEVESAESFIHTKNALITEIDALKSRLALKSVVENTNNRIAELEKLFKTLNQELASLERMEFTLKKFEFAKNSEYESRINKMFEFTKFKLFHTQVDGQIIPTCEATVNGVPYSTLNNAMQVGCGLDIINTVSKFNDKFAPIWIDNREGVTEIPVMKSQVINLVVNPECKSLNLSTI